MKVREFLQTELWSTETSRRISRKIWKIAKPVFAVFGVLILLLAVVFAVEWYWMTTGERNAGKAALAKIEELKQLESNVSDRFDAVNRQAKALTTAADQKAWTLRDRRTATLLELYRWELETEHESRLEESKIRSLAKERHLELPPESQEYKELQRKSQALQAQIFSSFRSELHKELD